MLILGTLSYLAVPLPEVLVFSSAVHNRSMFTLSQAGALAPELPAASILPELKGALETVGKAIVTAEPGSGKTTLVPPFCWALEDARVNNSAEAAGVIVTEPRRVAARAAAS